VIGGQHGVLEDAGDAAGDHMGAAQVGLGEGRQNRAVLLLASEIDVAHQRLNRRAASRWARPSFVSSNEKRATERQPPLLSASFTARSRSFQKAWRANNPVAGSSMPSVSRIQQALEMTIERLQAHEREQALDQAFGIAVHLNEVGQPVVAHCWLPSNADRKVAKACILGQHRQERLDHPGPESVADDDALDVAGIEKTSGSLYAHRTDQPDPLADRDCERRIERPRPTHSTVA